MEIILRLISLPFWTASFQQVFISLILVCCCLQIHTLSIFLPFSPLIFLCVFVCILQYILRAFYAFLFIIFTIIVVIFLSSWVCCLISLRSICYQLCISHSKYCEHIFLCSYPSTLFCFSLKLARNHMTVIFMWNAECLISCVRYSVYA